MGLPWAVGMMMTGALGYLIRDWRNFQLACSLPTLIIFPILYLINESPRWLIVTGKHKEALRVLRRAARLNGVTLPPDHKLTTMMADIQFAHNSKNEAQVAKAISDPQQSRWSLSCPKLLKTARIRLVTFCLSINLFILSLVYCGLSLGGSTYSNDPFLYVIISGLMEVPGYTIVSPVINRWGRKYPSLICFVVCGVVILSLTVIPSTISWLVMTFAMIGKMGITCAFMIVFVSQAELFPTEVRIKGLAVTSISGQIAGTIAPYIAEYLGPMVPWLPSVIFGVSSFVGVLAVIPLPETLGKNLPDTTSHPEGSNHTTPHIRTPNTPHHTQGHPTQHHTTPTQGYPTPHHTTHKDTQHNTTPHYTHTETTNQHNTHTGTPKTTTTTTHKDTQHHNHTTRPSPSTVQPLLTHPTSFTNPGRTSPRAGC
ncbi:hypothetical protein Pcinc_043368 [Petrolisthes cinctipes]|uniref:Major facilitator superfamily (MFS) profile domain-containing protein n=1 Tax=Petrolisthes cinctipes TaxID=88211 RepID=A0AAE1BJ96_PETCI|nr:hypothetical protein Pcinc_043368 [Petrolisthes cinctipes]